MTSKARCVLLAIFILCLLCSVFIHLLGVQTFNYLDWKSKHKSSKLFRSRMYILPTPLPAASGEEPEGSVHSYYGYEFKLPWKKIDQKREAVYGFVLSFKEGCFITIFDPSGNANHAEALVHLTPGGNRNQLVEIFGPEFVKPNYNALKTVLHATPDQIEWLMSKEDSIRLSALLTSRYVMVANLPDSVIYEFQHGDIKGFQQGNPSSDKLIMLRFFDKNDKELTITIGAAPEKELSQDDLSVIIRSFRLAEKPAEE